MKADSILKPLFCVICILLMGFIIPAIAFAKDVNIKGIVLRDYRKDNSGGYAKTLAIATKYTYYLGNPSMLTIKFTHYVYGVPASRYIIRDKPIEMRVKLLDKQVRTGAYVRGAYAQFIAFAGATKQAMEQERLARERAEAEAAKESERIRQEQRAEAQRRAAQAEEQARREAEQKEAKQKALEAQPSRLLLGTMVTWRDDSTMELKLADLHYLINKCPKLCLDPDTQVKVTVRRVDPTSGNYYQCDFVAWDAVFLKDHEAKIQQSNAKKEAIHKRLLALNDQAKQLQEKRQPLFSELSSQLVNHGLFKIVGKVTDIDRDRLIIFGKAIPVDGNMQLFGTQLREASILVLNPGYYPGAGQYVGDHHFLRKTQGTNAFGASVPVWVYGDLPEDVFKRVDGIKRKIDQIDTEIVVNTKEIKEIEQKLKRCVLD